MENNLIIDFGKPLRDILATIGVPPEPTAVLEQVAGRMGDPDISALVTVIHDQLCALKAAEAVVGQMYTYIAAPAIAEVLAAKEGEGTVVVLPETGREPEFDESMTADLVERMKLRLDDPDIKELVLALELQTHLLRRMNQQITELLAK